MGRSTRFPDLREFRARAARLGNATGPVEAAPGARREPIGGASVPWMWIGLASFAVVALGWLALGALPGAGDGVELASRDDLDEVVAEVRAANERVARLEAEVGALRRDDDVDRDAKADLLRRIELIERAFGPPTGAIEPGPDEALLPPSILDSGVLDAGEADAGPMAAGGAERDAVDPLPQVAGLPGRADRPAGEQAEPGRRAVLPAYAFAVDLGGFGSVGELKRYWSRIVNDNPLLLGGLAPRQLTRLEPDGIGTYRLIAGPLENVADSRRVCDALRLRGAECTQTIHAGEPL